jgi:Zn-finger nucleic acid-binding protein
MIWQQYICDDVTWASDDVTLLHTTGVSKDKGCSCCSARAERHKFCKVPFIAASYSKHTSTKFPEFSVLWWVYMVNIHLISGVACQACPLCTYIWEQLNRGELNYWISAVAWQACPLCTYIWEQPNRGELNYWISAVAWQACQRLRNFFLNSMFCGNCSRMSVPSTSRSLLTL